MLYVYILLDRIKGQTYTGLTDNLKRRMKQHKSCKFKGSYTCGTNINKLYYYERFDNFKKARKREKEIKFMRRIEKFKLIQSKNPNWKELL